MGTVPMTRQWEPLFQKFEILLSLETFFSSIVCQRASVYNFCFASNSFKENYFSSAKLPISHLKKTDWKESFQPVPTTKHQFIHSAILLYESFVHH